MAGYSMMVSLRGLINDVVIDKSVRGQGFGTRLMKTLLHLAEPLEVLFLHADPKMHCFYGKFKFIDFQGISVVKRNKNAELKNPDFFRWFSSFRQYFFNWEYQTQKVNCWFKAH